MKTNLLFVNALIWCGMMCCSCGDKTEDPTVDTPQQETARPEKESGFARGADVSWLTQLEAEGQKFYAPGSTSRAMECMELLRDYCGVNAIRLRVWVNPADGWNNIDDVIVKARRAENLGLRTMIDFHFSDTWADPGHQSMPAEWEGLDNEGLLSAVAGHVKAVLRSLDEAGVNPEWVQIGNEISPGLMLPAGDVEENPGFMTEIINAGYDAAKSVFPTVRTIVHLDGAHESWKYEHFFDVLGQYGGKYDMIGMSVYPYWAEEEGYEGGWRKIASDVISNIDYLRSRYSKPVMICEIGVPYDVPEVASELIAMMMETPVEGIFYWEPEAPAGYNDGYNMGCFNNGVPTVALEPFVRKR